MKKNLVFIGFLAIGFISFSFIKKEKPAAKIEYKVVTSVESIVPNGLGRSRLISSNVERDYDAFTSERSSEKKEDERNKSNREDIRIKDFEETKLLNFFNIGGIRFQNIAANHAVMTSKVNTMVAGGCELALINRSFESEGG